MHAEWMWAWDAPSSSCHTKALWVAELWAPRTALQVDLAAGQALASPPKMQHLLPVLGCDPGMLEPDAWRRWQPSVPPAPGPHGSDSWSPRLALFLLFRLLWALVGRFETSCSGTCGKHLVRGACRGAVQDTQPGNCAISSRVTGDCGQLREGSSVPLRPKLQKHH